MARPTPTSRCWKGSSATPLSKSSRKPAATNLKLPGSWASAAKPFTIRSRPTGSRCRVDPNSNLQGNSKLQIHKPCSGGYEPPVVPNGSTLPAFSAEVDWSLKFGPSLELGFWSLMLPAGARPTHNTLVVFGALDVPQVPNPKLQTPSFRETPSSKSTNHAPAVISRRLDRTDRRSRHSPQKRIGAWSLGLP